MGEANGAQGPRGWYYGWNIVGVLMLSQVAANSLIYNAFSLFLKGWSSQLHVPVSRLMLAIMAMIVVASPVSAIVGVLADKYPPRRIFAAGLLGMGVFNVAISFVTDAWQIIALYALLAAPALTMCTAVPANALISRWFVRRIGLALALSAFGIGLGGVLMPPIVAALLPAAGWRMIWRVGGIVIVVLVMPLVLFVIRNRPTEREGLHYLSDDGAARRPHAHGHGAGGDSGLGWRDVLRRRNFWLLVAVYLSIMATGSGLVQNIAPFASSRGFGTETAGLLLAVISAAHLVATLALGMLADRFGVRLPLAGLCLLVALGVAILAASHGLPGIVLGAALIGCNSAVFTPLAAGIAAEFGAHGFGRAFGLAMAFLPLGTPLAYILARTEEMTGSYLPALIAFIVLLIAASALSLLLREGARRDGMAQDSMQRV